MTNGQILSNILNKVLSTYELSLTQQADVKKANGSLELTDKELEDALYEVDSLIEANKIKELIRIYKLLPKPSKTSLPNITTLSKVERMNSLYSIIDKNSNNIKMKLNTAQAYTLKVMNNTNRLVILKSRQRGFTTFRVIESLDRCLSIPNTKIGLQSFDLKSANAMADKIKLAYNSIVGVEVPSLVKCNNSEISFSNGSMITITTTFRSQTLASLHISELGKISLDAEKVAELKSGSFPAVGKGDITIESTSEGEGNYFHELWESSGEWTKLFVGWLGIVENGKLIPNTQDLDCYKSFDTKPDLPKELGELLVEIQNELKYKLEDEQVVWAIHQYHLLGDDINEFKMEYPALPKHAWESSIEGLIFSQAYTQLAHKDGVYNPNLPTYCALDLGMSDSTAIVVFQIDLAMNLHIIDSYNNNGKQLSHYTDWINSHSYNIIKAFLPHDAQKRELSSGDRIIQIADKLLNCDVTRLRRTKDLWNSIQRTRNHMRIMHFNTSNTTNLIKAIKKYRKKWVNGMYTDTPLHGTDGTSDLCDSLRYVVDAYVEHLT